MLSANARRAIRSTGSPSRTPSCSASSARASAASTESSPQVGSRSRRGGWADTVPRGGKRAGGGDFEERPPGGGLLENLGHVAAGEVGALNPHGGPVGEPQPLPV